jgi:hypothetical protein
MEYPLPQQVEVCASEPLALHKLEAVDVAFDGSGAPHFRQCCPHARVVLMQSSGKGLEFSQVTHSTGGEPPVKVFHAALADDGQELLGQVVGHGHLVVLLDAAQRRSFVRY